jgi:hypothetical protein
VSEESGGDADLSLAAALSYCALNWAAIPAVAGTKHPAIRWQAFEKKLPDEAQIRKWFSRWPDANIAVVTGKVSKLLVLDIDPVHGGQKSLAGLEKRYGKLPETVEAITGGGGRHLYFRHPGGEVRNRTAIAPGIDLRGDGGVIITPPSLHPSGRRYVWLRGHGPDQIPLAEIPLWLAALIEGEGPHLGHSLSHWRALVREGVDEGARNATIASLTGHLLKRQVDEEVVMELMLAWNRQRCRPPLDDDEVIRTVDSIARTHARQQFPEWNG